MPDAEGRGPQVDALIAANPWATKKIFSAQVGGNGFAQAGTQALLDQINELAAYYDARRAAGYKALCITWTPRTTPTFNPAKDQVNAAMRGWVPSHCDALADFGADPLMGPDAATGDTSLYLDGIHPTPHGQAILESDIAPLILGF